MPPLVRLFLLFLGVILVTPPRSLAQAPDSVAGRAAEMKITEGNGPFASSGSSRLLMSATDNTYGLVSISGQVSSSYGTFSYSKTSNDSAVANVLDSVVQMSQRVSLSFSSASEGTFLTTIPSAPGYQQRGTFRLYTGPSPASVKGMTFEVQVDAGTAPFSSYGSFSLRTDPTSNAYQINGGYGVSQSTGTYVYTPKESGMSTIVLKDSQTGASMSQTLSWDTTTAGAYVVRDAEMKGYQAGTFKVVASISPPTITTQPTGTTVAAGGSVVLTVSGTSRDPISYQWRKGGIPIVGATASRLSLTAVTESTAGTYDVVVSSASGTTTSVGAEVRVVFPASILTPPEAVSAELGNTVSLSVSVSGTPPFTFKWRKNGAVIPSATTDTLVLNGVKAGDFGSYTVEVSNSVGSATSAPVDLSLGEKVVITTQPSSVSTRPESAATFTVTAAGTEPLSYQWKKDGNVIPGATRASLTIPRATLSEVGSYEVFVYNAFGNATSIPAQLSVAGEKGITLIDDPSKSSTASLTIVRGSNGSVSVRVDAVDPSLARTTYRVLRLPTVGPSVPLGPSSPVPANGIINLPLRSIAEPGTYAVEYVRQYMDGSPEVRIVSEPFTVETIPMEAAAGVYEMLLEDANHAIPDSANYRGILIVTVTKTGSVSGRLMYNEAPELYGSDDSSLRVYKPVTRSFTGGFTASETSTQKLVCSPKLGVGTQTGRQELSLELDFTTVPTSLSVSLTDRVSVPKDEKPEGALSSGLPTNRSLTKLDAALEGSTTALNGSLGRYNISSSFQINEEPSPGTNQRALIFAQVLTSGRVLWTSRVTGQSGSGSSGLRVEESNALVAPFYEGRLSSTSKLHLTHSLLGLLQLAPTENSGWQLNTRVGYRIGGLERQSSFLTKINDRLEYSEWLGASAQGTKSANWTGVCQLDLSAAGSGLWGGTTKTGLLQHFSRTQSVEPESAPRIGRLKLEDPADQTAYSWMVSISSTGVIRTAPESSSQPTLLLRFDKLRGEFSGSYTPNSPEDRLRRTIIGAALLEPSEEAVRAHGWVELNPLPATKTAGWTLEMVSP